MSRGDNFLTGHECTTDIPGTSHEFSGDAIVIKSNNNTTSVGSIKTN
jgi:hypothetical protein